MSQIVIPKITCLENNEKTGRFTAEALEKGFGVTLGNALRRVLLGYLPGTAITKVKIEGVLQEFTSLPLIKEDVMEFLLNLKAIRIKSFTGEPGKLILDVSGEGKFTAADIKSSTDYEIINPELHLVTLDTKEARLYVELDVETDRGYRPADTSVDTQADVIGVDAIFTPIRKVNYYVEPTYIGRETSYERLVLEITTDGTITPLDALSQSSRILVEQLSPFASCAVQAKEDDEQKMVHLSIPDEKYNMPVEQLDLSVRTMNCLRHAEISTVGEIMERGEKGLMSLRNFGQKSRKEIEDRLQEIGLTMSTNEEDANSDPDSDSLE